MSDFATVDDVKALWRSLTTEESDRTEALLPLISDALRDEAAKRGKDLDAMIEAGTLSANTAKMVTVGIVVRVLSKDTAGSSGVLSQESQSALGYSWSGTYVSTGGGLVSILNNDLKQLGLLRQTYGAIKLYAEGN